MKLFWILVLVLVVNTSLTSQELSVNVQVNTPQLKLVDPKIFENLEKEIYDFFNNTKWTDDELEKFEKIEGNINISITEEISATSFVGDFYIQAIRPVYNSTYKTQVLNYADKGFAFGYQANQPIQNNFNIFTDQLSCVLTFYAYLILGYDYDSFEPFGGENHFNSAQQVMSNIPQSGVGGTGWDPTVRDNLSRYNLINDLLNPRMRPFRQAMYEYHLKSLDHMHTDANKARAVMLSAVTAVQQVNQAVLNSAVVQLFCDSKREEIIEIYKGAARGDQAKIYDLMVKLDPARASSYSNIK